MLNLKYHSLCSSVVYNNVGLSYFFKPERGYRRNLVLFAAEYAFCKRNLYKRFFLFVFAAFAVSVISALAFLSSTVLSASFTAAALTFLLFFFSRSSFFGSRLF
jgi:hypothetical protein